jgi:hypothetical protein
VVNCGIISISVSVCLDNMSQVHSLELFFFLMHVMWEGYRQKVMLFCNVIRCWLNVKSRRYVEYVV